MKLPIIYLLFSLALLVVGTSCGKKKSEAPKNAFTFVGTWTYPCFQTSDKSNYEMVTMVALKESITTTVNFFDPIDSNCSTLLQTLVSNQTYILGNPIAGMSDTYGLDLTLQSMVFSVHSPALITLYNTDQGLFNSTNWAVDTAVDITGLQNYDADTNVIFAKGDVDYNIVHVSAQTLTMGDESGAKNGSSDSLRPIELGSASCLGVFRTGSCGLNKTTPTRPISLAGTWKIGCFPPLKNYYYETVSMVATASTIDTTTNYYEINDANCSNVLFTVEKIQKFTVGNPVLGMSNTYVANFTNQKWLYTLHTAGMVAEYNALASYGSSKWVVDTEVDVTGQQQSQYDKVITLIKGTIDYNIVQVNGTILTFGDESDINNGTTDLLRPTVLSKLKVDIYSQ